MLFVHTSPFPAVPFSPWPLLSPYSMLTQSISRPKHSSLLQMHHNKTPSNVEYSPNRSSTYPQPDQTSSSSPHSPHAKPHAPVTLNPPFDGPHTHYTNGIPNLNAGGADLNASFANDNFHRGYKDTFPVTGVVPARGLPGQDIPAKQTEEDQRGRRGKNEKGKRGDGSDEGASSEGTLLFEDVTRKEIQANEAKRKDGKESTDTTEDIPTPIDTEGEGNLNEQHVISIDTPPASAHSSRAYSPLGGLPTGPGQAGYYHCTSSTGYASSNGGYGYRFGDSFHYRI